MIKKIKDNLKKLAIKKVKLLIADMLLITSFFIIFFTTFSLNKYVAMYLLSAIFIVLSYFVAKEVR